MAPVVRVSTRRMKGIIDNTLWWEEKGVNQCTARLWPQTMRTGMFIGRIQSIRMRIECAKLLRLAWLPDRLVQVSNYRLMKE